VRRAAIVMAVAAAFVAPAMPAAAAPPSTASAAVMTGLPSHSGSGRRIVYSRAQQQVWAVDAQGRVVKTHRVSGLRNSPRAGTYRVFSRSLTTFSTENRAVTWRYMVRFAHGPDGGNIGFHEIPTKRGVPLQSVAQLGEPLSHGCVRQSHADALWTWNWAGVGTKVVVL
jgi:lipoprotein-anchoring transpeptidase ErfK/SrfK